MTANSTKATKALAAVIIIVVAFTIPIAVYIGANQSQSANPRNEPKVEITIFEVGDWSYLGGVAFDCPFNLTVANTGAANVSGLVLQIKQYYSNGTDYGVANYFFSGVYENGTIAQPLGSGESRDFRGTMLSNIPQFSHPSNATATLSLNGIVLGERRAT